MQHNEMQHRLGDFPAMTPTRRCREVGPALGHLSHDWEADDLIRSPLKLWGLHDEFEVASLLTHALSQAAPGYHAHQA